MNEIHFELEHPVKYSHGGTEQEGGFITLVEPSMKLLSKTTPFKSAFYAASVKMSSSDDGDDSGDDDNDGDNEGNEASAKKMTGTMVMGILHAYTKDMSSLLNKAMKLFCIKGVASVEGEVDMTMAILETMHPDDFENMLGEYLVNFTLASALKKDEQDTKCGKSSDSSKAE